MRTVVIGIVIGVVVGVVFGATVIAPRLTTVSVSKSPETVVKPLPKLTSATVKKSIRRWKMASAYHSKVPMLGTMAKRLESGIWRVSDGGFEIKFHEPNALVPPSELFNAVSSGAIDAAFTTPEMWVERLESLGLFSSVPFGPKPMEHLAWIFGGGGLEIYNDILHKEGVHGVFCGLISNGASGWFRREIKTVEDLKGLKVRSSGLGAEVMEKLGVKIKTMAAKDVFIAFETGKLDGAAISLPSVDAKLGVHKVAKHFYYPAWNRPAMLFDIIINLKTWNALPVPQKTQINTVCAQNINLALAEGEAAQFAALKAIEANKVQIHRWPTEIISALEKAWRQQAIELSNADSDFRRVWESLSGFRRDYSIWNDFSQ
jgi:TRAP-type mannitol/chloroaromatic compound transport system substrate-binding protein